MSDPLQALFGANDQLPNPYPATSRYFGIKIAKLSVDGDEAVVYLRRRFIPSADRFQLLQYHTVTQGDRLDNITAKYLGDPEQFWRLCDANNAMRPEELTKTIGRLLRITLPAGITGSAL
ncbi:MAG TPA: LysM domain-containing protein [Chloroflexota bacterium]|nr:LysM domain-containing protein [Chloroflexota bacterium]